jgi:hypothetical protein
VEDAGVSDSDFGFKVAVAGTEAAVAEVAADCGGSSLDFGFQAAEAGPEVVVAAATRMAPRVGVRGSGFPAGAKLAAETTVAAAVDVDVSGLVVLSDPRWNKWMKITVTRMRKILHRYTS